MKIKTEIVQGIFIVTCEGNRLDALFAKDFFTAMKGFIQKGHVDILLDLSAVDFVDSTGLGSIVRCLNEIGGHGQLALCGVSEAVLSLLQITRLDRVLTQAGDRKEALENLSWEKKKGAGTTLSAVSGIPEDDEDEWAILLEVEDDDDKVLEVASDERRRHRRIGHRQILDEDLVAYCTNTTTGKNSTGVILNISPGGILMVSTSARHAVGDDLLVSSVIGRNFKLKELTRIKSSDNGKYGLEFIRPSPETKNFLNQLTGSVSLESGDRFRHF